jgi:hypothetical protein
MAKSVASGSDGDAVIKACAQQFNLPKKALRRAVQEATLRLVAEKIARERIEPTWKEVVDRTKPPKKRPRGASAKAERAPRVDLNPSN